MMFFLFSESYISLLQIHLFSQHSYNTHPSSLHLIQQFWSLLTPHQSLFCNNQFQHSLPRIFILDLITYSSPYTLSRWRETYNTDVAHTYCSTSLGEFEECRNKAGDHTWRKSSRKENRRPVAGKGIRLLLFDRCKFSMPFSWKKCWTRQTTHLSHIYRI